jgi:hypothetical protein
VRRAGVGLNELVARRVGPTMARWSWVTRHPPPGRTEPALSPPRADAAAKQARVRDLSVPTGRRAGLGAGRPRPALGLFGAPGS